MIIAFQSLDDQIVNWKPNRSSPIGISAEEMSVSFAGNIIDAVFTTIGAKYIGLGSVDLGEGTDSERRKKLIFIQQIAENSDTADLWWEPPEDDGYDPVCCRS